MANVLLWIGVVLTVTGWVALAWQASKRMAVKERMQKFQEMRKQLLLRRNYCWLTIMAGVALIVIAVII